MVRPFILGAAILAASSMALAQTTTSPGKAPATSAAPATAAGSVAQYASQSDATAKCGSDTVVWANATSKVLHPSGDRYFGKSKHGFFTCEKSAMAAGYHMAGHRKHAAKSA